MRTIIPLAFYGGVSKYALQQLHKVRVVKAIHTFFFLGDIGFEANFSEIFYSRTS